MEIVWHIPAIISSAATEAAPSNGVAVFDPVRTFVA
jgi:hypothetical protein